VGLGAPAYYRGRPRERSRVPRWVVLAAASAIGVSVFGAFGSTLLQVYRLEREAAQLAQHQRDLEEQNAQLRAEIQALHTPEYVEKLAREQLGLVKPGEVAFLIVQTPADTPPGRGLSPDSQARPAPARPDWFARLGDAVRHLLGR
jgi:cell division protein FtsL